MCDERRCDDGMWNPTDHPPPPSGCKGVQRDDRLPRDIPGLEQETRPLFPGARGVELESHPRARRLTTKDIC